MSKRKPTRRDLLIIVGRLQSLCGSIKVAASDRNRNSAAQLEAIADSGVYLCVEATSYDKPIKPSGPWADDGADGKWQQAM